MQEWLNHQYQEQLHYAICIEETEAWLLPLYENKSSYTSAKPKEKLLQLLQKKNVLAPSHYNEYQKMSAYSKLLRKAKNIKKARQNNPSLDDFLKKLEADSN